MLVHITWLQGSHLRMRTARARAARSSQLPGVYSQFLPPFALPLCLVSSVGSLAGVEFHTVIMCLGTVGVSTQLSHPKQQLGAWGSSGAGHAVTHTSDTCLPSTGANPYWYGGVLVMLGWVGGASPARP